MNDRKFAEFERRYRLTTRFYELDEKIEFGAIVLSPEVNELYTKALRYFTDFLSRFSGMVPIPNDDNISFNEEFAPKLECLEDGIRKKIIVDLIDLLNFYRQNKKEGQGGN